MSPSGCCAQALTGDFHLTNHQVSDFFEPNCSFLLLKTVQKESKTSVIALVLDLDLPAFHQF